jgi:Fe-Mn family superoxide dismutase
MNRRHVLRTLALGAASLPLVRGDATAAAAATGSATTAAGAQASVQAAPAGPFALPPLGYAYDALEPHLDARTMELHHARHHAAYVARLNQAVAGRAEVEGWPLERLLRELDRVPEDIRQTVRNHGGGHANHTLLWTSLKKDGARAASGDLAGAIDAAFGSFGACSERLAQAAAGVFGSGWAWLTSGTDGVVRVETTANQDSPLTSGRVPLLGIDVWEHAYYLKFQNRRAEYVAAFAAVVDWDVVSGRYREAAGG